MEFEEALKVYEENKKPPGMMKIKCIEYSSECIIIHINWTSYTLLTKRLKYLVNTSV